MTKPRKDVRFQHRRSSVDNSVKRTTSASSGSHDSPNGSIMPDANGSSKQNGSAGTDHSKKESTNDHQADWKKKKQSIITRTIWSFIMIGGFFVALLSGHIYVIMLVTAIQILSFNEVIAISNVPSRAKSLRFTKSLSWYFLGTTMYFLYGESVVYYFKHIVLVDQVLLPFATHHRFISFVLYVTGFVFFVTSLQKGHYKFQFTQFAWTHLALAFIVVQAHFIMNNIFEGLFWFFIPVALVIVNDIFAYICGMTFGKTPLIQLSPKKTVEGFAGAWVFTVLGGIGFTWLLSRSTYFTCPVNDLGANIFTGLNCETNPVFLNKTYHLSEVFTSFFPHIDLHLPFNLPTQVTFPPIYAHVFVLSTWASLVAPFGGFFASGLKRTFKIKDFGDSIPGHGGMTDRMDCQFIMGFFAFMYYQSFIRLNKTTVGQVLETAIMGLTTEEQLELIQSLSRSVLNRGLIDAKGLKNLVAELAKR